MGKHLIIAGHGKQRNGTFDPGATGFITKGEHKYVVEDLFPSMQKHLPKGHDVVFFSDYKVSNHGNIVALAKQFNASQITEIHFDAASASASGGHVIIYKGYEPDKVDLALRDAIDSMVGVRYTHKGHKGISGRDDLFNVNATAKGKVTYRLIELGFGTNKHDADILINKVDQYAKELVKAITGKVNSKTSKPTTLSTPKPSKPSTSKKSIVQMAQEVIDGKHGNGHDNRRKSLGISKTVYEKVSADVNHRAGVSAPKPKKSISKMATEVINGQHGNGHSQRQKSLSIDNATYQKVRAEVNRRLK